MEDPISLSKLTSALSLSSLSMETGDVLTGLSKEMKKQFVDVWI